MKHLIYQVIRGRIHYWNTCGWSDNIKVARRYSPADSKPVFNRMTKAGIRCVLTSVAR